MSPEEFRTIVSDAIDALPDEFKARIENVEIVIEDRPTKDQLSIIKRKGYTLLGLYEGVPLKKRSVFAIPNLPDKITLFKETIEEACRTKEKMTDAVRRTLFHEIGHYFGLSDKRLRELGF